MKILFYMPGTILGGAETQLQTLCRELKLRGHELLVVTNAHNLVTPFWLELQKHANIIPCDTKAQIATVIQKTKPDVIQHFHNPTMDHAMELADYRGVGIEVVHGCLHFDNDVTRTPKTRTTHVVAVSDSAQQFFTSALPWWKNKTSVIPNGIDTKRFSPRAEDPESGRPIRILHVGRLCEGDKLYTKIIDACVDLQVPWELWLVGTGVDFQEIKNYADYHGHGKVKFFGFTPNPEYHYREADIYISRSPSEGFGLSIAEAAASGLPITMWNCGGIASYFTSNYDCRIADRESEFNHNLRYLVTDAAARHRMGIRARELTLSKFSAESMATQYEELYTRLIVEKKKQIQQAEPVIGEKPKLTLKIVGISNPNWNGVTNATKAWVGKENWVPMLTSADPGAVNEVLHRQPDVLLLGGDSNYYSLAELVRKKLPKTKILLTWHGTFALNDFAPKDGEILSGWVRALRAGVIDRIGFVRDGMADAINHPGAVYFPNRLPTVPKIQAQPQQDGKCHIGIFGTGYPWKNVQAMIIGASMIKNSVIHVNGIRDRKLIDELGIKVVEHGKLDRHDFVRLLARMHVNIQGSFTESFGLTFCESYLLGVPCATTPGVQVLPEVSDTQIADPDNVYCVAGKLLDLIKQPRVAMVQERLMKLDQKNADQVRTVLENMG